MFASLPDVGTVLLIPVARGGKIARWTITVLQGGGHIVTCLSDGSSVGVVHLHVEREVRRGSTPRQRPALINLVDCAILGVSRANQNRRATTCLLS